METGAEDVAKLFSGGTIMQGQQYDLFVPYKVQSPEPVKKTCVRRKYGTERAALNSTHYLTKQDRIAYGDPFWCSTCEKWHMQLKKSYYK